MKKMTIINVIKDKFFNKPLQEWIRINGDGTLRLNYPLDENSVVFDVGGFKGNWANDIYSKYHCKIYIFEIVNSFLREMQNKFNDKDKIKIFRVGLSNKNEEKEVYINTASSSVYIEKGEKERVNFVKANEFIKSIGIDKIDLIKINIEGGEYDLLENLIESDFVKNIKNIQVQFHNFIPNYNIRMDYIREQLNKTHKLTWYYKGVWENWELKR